MITRTLTRKGAALIKTAKCYEDYEPDIDTFQEALTEHRNSDTFKKPNETERAKIEQEEHQEYFNPKLGNEEREKGSCIMADDHNTCSSYLYLHPSESPATSLVSPVLESNNYHAWSKSMITSLSAKNKVQFVDGTATEPKKEDASYNAWKRCNSMVVCWLMHSVSPRIRLSILWMESAQAIWDDLKSRFFQGDLLRISELQTEAASLRQGDSTVTEFFTKLRMIWGELENVRPEPVCTCEVKCSCNMASVIAQRKTEDHAMQFLRGLNEKYRNVKFHVLPMDPIPPISKVFSYVVQQERQIMSKNFLTGLELKNVAAVNTVSCSYCGKSGHTDSVCFKKHGFPANKNSNNRNICSHCGKNGHTVEVCYRKHGFPPGHKFHNGKSFLSKSQD